MKKQDDVLYIFLHVMKCAGTTVKIHIEKNFKKDEILPLYLEHNNSRINYVEGNFSEKISAIDKYLKSLNKRKIDKIRVIYGHDTYYGIHKFFNKKARYIILLRDPVSRIISMYNYNVMKLKDPDLRKRYPKIQRNPDKAFETLGKNISENGKLLDFEPWFAERCDKNKMCRVLLRNRFINKKRLKDVNKEDIKEALSKFYFVGITENPEDFLFLYHELGINNFLPDANISKKYFIPEDYEKTKIFILSKNKYDEETYKCALKANKIFKKKHTELV